MSDVQPLSVLRRILPGYSAPEATDPTRDTRKVIKSAILGNKRASKFHGSRCNHPIKWILVRPIHATRENSHLGCVGCSDAALGAQELRQPRDDIFDFGPFAGSVLGRDFV